jgi:hypothetical protein
MATTPAATGAVRSATATNPTRGWQTGGRRACRSPPVMSSSPCPLSGGSSSATTSKTCRPSCAARRLSRSSRWPRTRTTAAAGSGCGGCCTPGPGPSPTLHTCTAWCRPVGSRRTTHRGGRLARRTSCRSGPSLQGAAVGAVPWYPRSAPLGTCPSRSGPPPGSSSANRRCKALTAGAMTGADLALASPGPTPVCSPAPMARSAVARRTAGPSGGTPCPSRPRR